MVVLGDLNDFDFTQTVHILGRRLHDLMDTLPLNERYSYEFEGNCQVLDHILVSGPLFAHRLSSTRCTSTRSSPTRRPTTTRQSCA